jgi:hypothetical protein
VDQRHVLGLGSSCHWSVPVFLCFFPCVISLFLFTFFCSQFLLFVAVVAGINVYLVENFITDPNSPTPHDWWFFLLVALIGLLYFNFISIVIWSDLKIGWSKVKKCFLSTKDSNSVSNLAFSGNATRRGSGVGAADYSVME